MASRAHRVEMRALARAIVDEDVDGVPEVRAELATLRLEAIDLRLELADDLRGALDARHHLARDERELRGARRSARVRPAELAAPS